MFQRYVLLLATVLGLSSAAAAQNEPAKAPGSGEPQITVNFPGGTVADYIATIRKAAKPAPVNITVMQQAAAAMLPPVQLDKVDIGTAVSAIEFVAEWGPDERWRVARIPGGDGATQAWAIALVRTSKGVGGVVESTTGSPGRSRMLEVFSIHELVEPPAGAEGAAVSTDTVLSAVELALKVSTPEGGDAAQAPTIKYHKDSDLLVLYAEPGQISAIRDLLDRMRSDVLRNRREVTEAWERAVKLDFELKAVQIKTEDAEARMGQAMASLDRGRKLREAGQMSDEELQQLELQARSAENNLKMMHLEASRLEQMRASVGSGNVETPGGHDDEEKRQLRQMVSQLQEQVAILKAKVAELEAKPRK